MKNLALALLVFTGCANAAAIKQTAYVVGRSSKIAVDGVYGEWDRRANDRITSCVEKLPPDQHTKSEYDECVGPYNSKTQSRALTLIEVVRNAQLVLFIVLSENRSDDEVKQALDDVVDAAYALRSFIEKNR